MIYATYTDGRSEETRGGLFYSFEDFHRATFSPSAVTAYCNPVSGGVSFRSYNPGRMKPGAAASTAPGF